MLFLSLQGFNSAETSASTEAQAAERMFHDAETFHAGLREDLHGSIVCYGRAVIFDEWPKLDDEEHSHHVEELGLEFEIVGARVDHADPIEAHALDQFLEADAGRAQARQERLDLGGSGTPTLLWVTLIMGWLLVAIYLCSFAKPYVRWWLQVIPVVAFATIGTFNLCVIAFLDRPFADVAGVVSPTAMEETLHAIDAEIEAEFPDTPIPCDEQGRPS